MYTTQSVSYLPELRMQHAHGNLGNSKISRSLARSVPTNDGSLVVAIDLLDLHGGFVLLRIANKVGKFQHQSRGKLLKKWKQKVRQSRHRSHSNLVLSLLGFVEERSKAG